MSKLFQSLGVKNLSTFRKQTEQIQFKKPIASCHAHQQLTQLEFMQKIHSRSLNLIFKLKLQWYGCRHLKIQKTHLGQYISYPTSKMSRICLGLLRFGK